MRIRSTFSLSLLQNKKILLQLFLPFPSSRQQQEGRTKAKKEFCSDFSFTLSFDPSVEKKFQSHSLDFDEKNKFGFFLVGFLLLPLPVNPVVVSVYLTRRVYYYFSPDADDSRIRDDLTLQEQGSPFLLDLTRLSASTLSFFLMNMRLKSRPIDLFLLLLVMLVELIFHETHGRQLRRKNLLLQDLTRAIVSHPDQQQHPHPLHEPDSLSSSLQTHQQVMITLTLLHFLPNT